MVLAHLRCSTAPVLVVTLLHSTDTEHFHSHGKFHSIALNTKLFSNPTLEVNPIHQREKKLILDFNPFQLLSLSLVQKGAAQVSRLHYLESKHTESQPTLPRYEQLYTKSISLKSSQRQTSFGTIRGINCKVNRQRNNGCLVFPLFFIALKSALKRLSLSKSYYTETIL